MRKYRRFELHKGNKEKFWEIKRHDKNLYFREGNIKRKTGEKDPAVKREEKKDFRQAQLAYDKEIQRKLSLGYAEVEKASVPSGDIDFQAIRLVSLDGKHTLDLNEAESTKVLNYMIDKLVFNKHTDVLNISKWQRRTLHGSEFSSLDEIDSLSEDYRTYFDKWLGLSERDRDYNEEDVIPLFKYTDPQYWIITEQECQQIIQSIQSEITKRRDVLTASDKKSSPYFRLKETWLEFHLAAKAGGGYQVIPCSLQFHSTKHGHTFFMDTRNWNDVYNTLINLDIWDRSQPAYVQHEYSAVEEYLEDQLLNEWGIDNEPLPLESSIQENLVQQLLGIEDQVNEAYRDILSSKKPNKDYSGSSFLDNGFRWNATNVRTLSKVLETMDNEIFETELEDYYNEEITEMAEAECEDGNIDIDTQRVINEILNDACHLINHGYQNISNTESELLPSHEGEHGDVFDVLVLAKVISVLKDLYPEILNHEVISEEQILADYAYRPVGLDDELMETWTHLLPDAVDCLSLLEGYFEFIQVEQELMEEYPNAKDFCLKYLKEASAAMKFRSELASMRRKTLSAESNTLGQVLLYKFTDLSEPWVITGTELSVIIEAVYQSEENNALIVSLMKFMNTAADSDGCTLLDTAKH